MKIATLSFELRGEKMALRSSERNSIILDTIKSYNPLLLVTAGFSLHDNSDLKNLQKELKKIDNKSWILVEVTKDESIIKNGHPLKIKYSQKNILTGTNNLYVINDKYEILNLGPQYFAQRKEVLGSTNKYRISAFEDILKNRIFNIDSKKVLVLNCGEINSIQGRDNITYISEKVREYIESADIILNPTHDCMANYGTLKAKRKFLSEREGKDTLYVNSSNWNTAKKRNGDKPKPLIRQNPRNNFMQNLYLNGEKVKMTSKITDKYLLHTSNIKL